MAKAIAIKEPGNFKILKWSEVREEVQKINHDLVDIIDAINCSKLEFCRVSYPFGNAIFKNGLLFVPNTSNKFVPISDPSTSEQCKKLLDYNSTPFGMVLNRSISESVEEEMHFASRTIFYPGQFFGLLELFNSTNPLLDREQQSLYAGTRSIFSTTKISNQQKYQTIKRKFNLNSKIPISPKDQFFLLKELVQHPHFSCAWSADVLLFPNYLREQIEKNKLELLQNFFLKGALRQAINWRFDTTVGVVWNQIRQLLKENGHKVFTCQVPALEHIVKLALGALPCFVSSDHDEITAPINLIKEILIDEYKIDFCPTIMVPGYLAREKYHYGYYSVNEATPIEEYGKKREDNRPMEAIRNLQVTYEFIKNSIEKNKGGLESHAIKKFFAEVDLSFFHNYIDKNNSLQFSSDLPNHDQSLIQLPSKYGKCKMPFNENGQFFRGGIKINMDRFFNSKIKAK